MFEGGSIPVTQCPRSYFGPGITTLRCTSDLGSLFLSPFLAGSLHIVVLRVSHSVSAFGASSPWIASSSLARDSGPMALVSECSSRSWWEAPSSPLLSSSCNVSRAAWSPSTSHEVSQLHDSLLRSLYFIERSGPVGLHPVNLRLSASVPRQPLRKRLSASACSSKFTSSLGESLFCEAHFTTATCLAGGSTRARFRTLVSAVSSSCSSRVPPDPTPTYDYQGSLPLSISIAGGAMVSMDRS